MNKLEIKNINKSFGSTRALAGIDLSIEAGRIYGLFGRNGAGKTTLLNIISNRLFADTGEVLIDGAPVRENDDSLSKLYCTAESNLFPDSMKVREAFRWTGEFYPGFNLVQAEAMAGIFKLDTGARIKSLSTGYASIFKFIAAMSSGTDILLLDEPVLGLDASHRDLFYRELVKNISETQRTILISTHLIDEAADILDEVIIIKAGKVLLTDRTEDLSARGYAVSGPAPAIEAFTAGRNVLGAEQMGGLKTAYLLEDSQPTGIPNGLSVSKLDLQKLFIHLTND